MAFGSLLYTSDTDKIKGSENLDSIYDKSNFVTSIEFSLPIKFSMYVRIITA